jgi:hypothetical protein
MKTFCILFLFLLEFFSSFSQTTSTVIAPSGVKIRQSPHANSQELVFAPKGSSVQILEKSDEDTFEDIRSYWYNVEYTNPEGEIYTGYCFGGFLTNTEKNYVAKKKEKKDIIVIEEEKENSSKIPYGMARVFTESGCSVRQYPTVNSEKIDYAPKGDFVKIIQQTKAYETIENKSGYWYKISYNGKVGYCFGGFLKVNN